MILCGSLPQIENQLKQREEILFVPKEIQKNTDFVAFELSWFFLQKKCYDHSFSSRNYVEFFPNLNPKKRNLIKELFVALYTVWKSP